MSLKQSFRFSGEYRDGKIIPDNTSELKAFISSQSGRFEAVLERESEDITKRQRGFYYGKLLVIAAKITGHSTEEIDGVLHKAFLTLNKGELNEYVRSTAEGQMTKEEYSNYISQCVQRLAEHGIMVSTADELSRLGLKNENRG